MDAIFKPVYDLTGKIQNSLGKGSHSSWELTPLLWPPASTQAVLPVPECLMPQSRGCPPARNPCSNLFFSSSPLHSPASPSPLAPAISGRRIIRRKVNVATSLGLLSLGTGAVVTPRSAGVWCKHSLFSPHSIIQLHPLPPPPPTPSSPHPSTPTTPGRRMADLCGLGLGARDLVLDPGYMAHYHFVTLLPHLVALCPPVTPALERWRQTDLPRVQGHAGQPDYIVRPCLKATQNPSLLCNSRKALISRILMGCCLSGALGFGVCKHNLTWK